MAIVESVGERLLRLVLPEVTAEGLSCWRECCNTRCTVMRTCCFYFPNTVCYPCRHD